MSCSAEHPATGTLTSGRIYAEISGAVDAGVAIANLSLTAATTSSYFTDLTGNSAGSGAMSDRATLLSGDRRWRRLYESRMEPHSF
jgi:hypothetical protein